MGPEEQRLLEGSQSEGVNMGKEFGPIVDQVG
jgi:hypothetical protein